ncbi:TetR/AcrR family transcriptional regulator [Mycobacterium novum]
MTAETDGRLLRGAATRARSLEAAAELFSSRGYSATSIAAIAEAAGVRSASLYHAFGSKARLLGAVVEHESDDFHAQLDAMGSERTLDEAIRHLMILIESRPRFIRLLLVLILERREDDAEVIEAAIRIRDRARARMAPFMLKYLPDDMTAARREEALERSTRILIALFDGVYTAHQLEADVDEFKQLFKLIPAAMYGVLAELSNSS